ncbi:Hypothetical protein D9617_14g076370 [Elsinoe fawcettii]|nr:Hypothetical protein D9617_14g076370 [Elsinoe fawcettii]
MAPASISSSQSDDDDHAIDTSFGPVTTCPTPPLPNLTSSSLPSPAIHHDGQVSKQMVESGSTPNPVAVHGALLHQAEKAKLPGTTLALDLAKRNYIDAETLRSGGLYDPLIRPLLFVTGVLQLPGTLNAALGFWDRSQLKLVKCMTPGRAMLRKENDDEEGPVQYSDAETSISGMVIMGRGKENRHMLDEWHGDKFVRVLVEVQFQTEDWIKRRHKAFTWVEKKALGWEVESDDSSGAEDEGSEGDEFDAVSEHLNQDEPMCGVPVVGIQELQVDGLYDLCLH